MFLKIVGGLLSLGAMGATAYLIVYFVRGVKATPKCTKVQQVHTCDCDDTVQEAGIHVDGTIPPQCYPTVHRMELVFKDKTWDLLATKWQLIPTISWYYQMLLHDPTFSPFERTVAYMNCCVPPGEPSCPVLTLGTIGGYLVGMYSPETCQGADKRPCLIKNTHCPWPTSSLVRFPVTWVPSVWGHSPGHFILKVGIVASGNSMPLAPGHMPQLTINIFDIVAGTSWLASMPRPQAFGEVAGPPIESPVFWRKHFKIDPRLVGEGERFVKSPKHLRDHCSSGHNRIQIRDLTLMAYEGFQLPGRDLTTLRSHQALVCCPKLDSDDNPAITQGFSYVLSSLVKSDPAPEGHLFFVVSQTTLAGDNIVGDCHTDGWSGPYGLHIYDAIYEIQFPAHPNKMAYCALHDSINARHKSDGTLLYQIGCGCVADGRWCIIIHNGFSIDPEDRGVYADGFEVNIKPTPIEKIEGVKESVRQPAAILGGTSDVQAPILTELKRLEVVEAALTTWSSRMEDKMLTPDPPKMEPEVRDTDEDWQSMSGANLQCGIRVALHVVAFQDPERAKPENLPLLIETLRAWWLEGLAVSTEAFMTDLEMISVDRVALLIYRLGYNPHVFIDDESDSKCLGPDNCQLPDGYFKLVTVGAGHYYGWGTQLSCALINQVPIDSLLTWRDAEIKNLAKHVAT